MAARPVIAVTTGEPAGIGPEICMALAARLSGATPGTDRPARIVLLGDRGLLAERARAAGVAPVLRDYVAAAAAAGDGGVELLHLPLRASCRAGRLDPANAAYVLALLERASDGCASGEFAAMVTAPVSKAVINDAGIPFTGHTEWLAERSGRGADGVVMLLVGGGLRVALATTHLALADVPRAIT
ncbi:MAG: 4-hydroxythreonine-4-phosphate dehydrogenase PdxA, partial [Betaproteobacteria bacterium]|nr:4-hydroxythreonine-4-phosphate dehydrogenase PdxA [Betaproteobacteria bacterium]